VCISQLSADPNETNLGKDVQHKKWDYQCKAIAYVKTLQSTFS